VSSGHSLGDEAGPSLGACRLQKLATDSEMSLGELLGEALGTALRVKLGLSLGPRTGLTG
jgi:hypothetical protein